MPICVEGYRSEVSQDLIGQKRKLGLIDSSGKDLVSGSTLNPQSAGNDKRRKFDAVNRDPTCYLHVNHVPPICSANALRNSIFLSLLLSSEIRDGDATSMGPDIIKYINGRLKILQFYTYHA